MINLWGLVSTFLIFQTAKRLKNFRIVGKIPPTVLTAFVLIGVLLTFDLSFENYNESASLYTILLGPATIALAYPLTENLGMLAKNKRAIYFGLLVATITALVVTFVVGQIFHSDKTLIISLLPKTVTTPIAVEVSKFIGGIPELTACLVVMTGIYGAVFGHKILKLVGVKNDVAIGLAIGAASHVLGTSTCVNRRRQVVMATLALIITGILTSVLCLLLF